MASADVLLRAQPPTRDPSAPDPTAAAPSRMDALTDLFDFSDNENSNVANNNNDHTTQQNNTSEARHREAREDGAQDLGLGIDEEIKIRKPRKPVAKLDTERLLSQKGIPKLRRITKERLKFRGKGHEFSDIAQLLTTYQLWLDDLFPKANFLDGLSLIEKLGHTNHLRVMRRAWIDEERKQNEPPEEADDDADFVEIDGQEESNPNGLWREADAEINSNEVQTIPLDGGIDDIYSGAADLERAERRAEGADEQPTPDVPDEDELDALMAEDSAKTIETRRPPVPERSPNDDDFADEEEAMAGMW